MKILTLYLKAFGPFTEKILEFGPTGQGLVLIYGPNEAGKSALLRAISDLRFGIPMQSKDNFVHAYPDIRIGGLFLDREGRQHALIRRKGRGSTLHFADIENNFSETDSLVSPELEAMLNGGLRRDEYDAMFGLDHQRLRDGGEALLKGQGEIGAAIFEASAGVRSISAILELLDQTARRIFMPGPRAKNGLINEALRVYDEHQNLYKSAVVRPVQWGELFKKHESAKEDLNSLESHRLKCQSALLSVKELRAVEPLLRALDQADESLKMLEGVTFLSSDATSQRVAAETELSTARLNNEHEKSEETLLRARLADLELDSPVLAIASAIERLGPMTETVDSHRKDLADTTVEIGVSLTRVAGLALQITPKLEPVDLIKLVPAATIKADIEEKLRFVDQANQSLVQHKKAIERLTDDLLDTETFPLPSQESRTILRGAQLELTRSDTILQRLAALPAEIKEAQRGESTALTAIGVSNIESLQEVRPLLDAEIDAAKSFHDRNTTRLDELESRITETATALAAEESTRDRLLEGGIVPTQDDVSTARSHRDLGWSLVRGTYIDATNPAIADYSGHEPLPEIYERAVKKADQLIDELAQDSARAEQLQSSLHRINVLNSGRQEFERQVTLLKNDASSWELEWFQKLGAAMLPKLLPNQLREWQGRLATALQAQETLQRKCDEETQGREIEISLAATLRQAIAGMGMTTPTDSVSLRTLSALATEIEEEIKQREKEQNTVAGKRQEREKQRKEMLTQEKILLHELQTAQLNFKPVLSQLLLPDDATTNVSRARLREFEVFATEYSNLDALKVKEARIQNSLQGLEAQADAIANALAETRTLELRLFIDEVVARLSIAKNVQAARTLAEQALEANLTRKRFNEETVTRCESMLHGLCLAAKVASSHMLPEAEDRAQRKREAQAEMDRARAQLAQASRHPADVLRHRLHNQDAACLDADEISLSNELTALDEKLPVARAKEEEARRALDEIDSADTAAVARERMEQAAASVRVNLGPWIRSRLAHKLLAEALYRFRDRV
ncbi:AAA family ATPase [Undibacterium sp. Di26W]|uniref:ATP-binding protein n=1 Tax=Undibacterium sp. Di26W TaxID=3413035 RepID=UPI003BF2C2C2